MLRFLAAAALVVVCAQPAAAQVCDDAAVITSLGSTVLEKRAELPKFQARHLGADALYLTMRYGDVSDDTVEHELAAMLEAGAPRARDLAFAWSYGMSNGMTERLLGPNAVSDALSGNAASAARAIIREDGVEALMTALTAIEVSREFAFRGAVVGTLDFSDIEKASLAKAAMAHDMPILAAGFVALQQKPKAWEAFIKTLDAETAELATQAWYWMSPLVGNPMLPRPSDSDVPGPTGYTPAKMAEVMFASSRMPQVDFLSTLVNQTGEIDKVLVAARAVNEATEAGELDPRDTPDAAWLLAYRTLMDTWGGTRSLQAQLAGFEVASGRDGGQDRTLGVLDRIVAVDALTPYLQGEAAEPPAMPEILSPNGVTAWPQWVLTAGAVKSNPSDAAHVGEDTLGAEMLFAAGRTDELARLIAEAPASSSVLRLATDIASRLDRRCESYLWHPAEGIVMPGTPIFKFDGRDNQ